MENEKTMELLNKIYIEMRKGLQEVRTGTDEKIGILARQTGAILGKIDGLEEEIRSTRKTVVKMETDHGQKLGALFDSYSHVTQRLDVIEKEQRGHGEKLDRMEIEKKEHGKRLDSMGKEQKEHGKKLDRIEAKVTKHDGIIFKGFK